MKKVSYMIIIALAVYALQGCNNNTKATNQNADSITTTKDTSGVVKASANPNGPANPLGTGNSPRVLEQKPMKVGNTDAKLASAMAEENLWEITMSIIAQQITRNTKIKAIADTIATGYNQINNDLIIIAKTKNMVVPTSISPVMQQQIEKLEKKSGKEFDKAYVSAIADGNKKALSLYEEGATSFMDADFKALVAKGKPLIQNQMNAIAAIRAGI